MSARQKKAGSMTLDFSHTKRDTIDFLADGGGLKVAPYTGTGMGLMRSNPNLGVGRSGHNAIATLDNERKRVVHDDSGAIVTLDNEVGLTTLDMPLTNYAVAYPGKDNLQAFLESIAGTVPSSDTFEYFVMNEKQNWVDVLSGDLDIRAVGDDFAKLPFGFKRANGATDEKGFTIRIDHRQGGKLPAVRQAQVARLKDILLRTEIRRVLALLAANATITATPNWGATNTAADPDGDIISAQDLSGDARGFNNNVVMLGGGASLQRKLCYRYLQGHNKSTLPYVIDPKEMAQVYECDQVIINNLRTQATQQAKGKILGNLVYGYYNQGLTPEDPSNIKRFINAGADGGFQVFTKEEARYTEITVWHQSRIICTSNIGIFQITQSYT